MIGKKTYKEYVLNTVENICPFKKKSKFTYTYYYSMFILTLKHINSWESLKYTKKYNSKKKYHYTTIRKMFTKWANNDVFKIAYNKMLIDNNLNVTTKDVDLFIDSAFINNKNGSELVGINPLYFKKNVTKLSFVCNTNKIPLSIVPFKSTANDVTTIVDSIEPLNIKKRFNLIGDKGYVLGSPKKKLLLKHHKIKLIVPKKKNQKKIRISKLMKSKLKVRNKVENCIQSIKSFNRIMIRKDRNLNNFMGFVYIACGMRLNEHLKIS